MSKPNFEMNFFKGKEVKLYEGISTGKTISFEGKTISSKARYLKIVYGLTDHNNNIDYKQELFPLVAGRYTVQPGKSQITLSALEWSQPNIYIEAIDTYTFDEDQLTYNYGNSFEYDISKNQETQKMKSLISILEVSVIEEF